MSALCWQQQKNLGPGKRENNPFLACFSCLGFDLVASLRLIMQGLATTFLTQKYIYSNFSCECIAYCLELFRGVKQFCSKRNKKEELFWYCSHGIAYLVADLTKVLSIMLVLSGPEPTHERPNWPLLKLNWHKFPFEIFSSHFSLMAPFQLLLKLPCCLLQSSMSFL